MIEISTHNPEKSLDTSIGAAGSSPGSVNNSGLSEPLPHVLDNSSMTIKSVDCICDTSQSPQFSSPISKSCPPVYQAGRKSFLDVRLSNSLDSLSSLYLKDCTPEIVDDITPTNSLVTNLVSEDEGNVINSQIPENSNDFSLLGIHDVLKNAGYSPSAIEKALQPDVDYNHKSIYGKSRPRTQVFYQGKVFTYEKLEVPTDGNLSKRSRVISSSKEQRKLNPDAAPFVPNVETSTVSLESSLFSLDKDAPSTLKNIRIDNINNVIIAQLNINSLRNKFQFLIELIHGNLDILVLTETKLDHTFPEKQFYVPGYKKPFRKDRNKNGGGVMIYVREDIPSDILMKHNIGENIEAIFVEINLRKNKLLLVGTYHSINAKYGTTDEEYFRQIGLALDVYSSTYDKFLLAGDFNVKEENDTLDEFLEDYHAKNLVKEPTCFKNPENPSCIDLFITNSFQSFQKTTTVTTGLSDFHNMAVTVLKTTFPKASPRIISYRSPYEVENLEKVLIENLSKMETKSYESFENMVMKSFDTVSAKKERTVRANEKPYVTKEIRKAIMLRSQLQNKVYYYGTEENTQAFNK